MSKKKVKAQLVESFPSMEGGASPKEEVKEKLFLSSQHLLAVESNARDLEISRLRVSEEDKNLKLLQLEHEILLGKMEKQRSILSAKVRDVTIVRAKSQTLMDTIFKEYKISEQKFGYDSVTGEIFEK